MKLQHLAIMFILIIIPISMVISEYFSTQISTIKLQTEYKTSLNTSTSDALNAFQINTVNNKYSSVSDSKIRDIEASVNTFYNSLGSAMSEYVTSKEELSTYIPALLFTLYDGYYIYSAYNNVYPTDNASQKIEIEDGNRNYQKGLRPYIYYSCKYKVNSNEVIVNYTLDNAITVYGKLKNEKGDEEYMTRSGYLIDYRKVDHVDNKKKELTYDGVEIRPEELKEHLITINEEDTGTSTANDYQYIVYNNKKVYMDVDKDGKVIYEDVSVREYEDDGRIKYDNYGNIVYQTINSPKFFWYDNYKKTYLKNEMVDFIKYLTDNNLYELKGGTLSGVIGYKSISAYEYYTKAKEFSEWLVNKSGLASVTQEEIVQNDGWVGAKTSDGQLYLSVDTGTKGYIFDTTTTTTENDPLLSSSTFNTHRLAVIRKSIETNLTTAIANYNKHSGLDGYEFVMPVMDEESWYRITNNVSLVSFMQGIPIGHKVFNNYSVVTNTTNEEVVNAQSVYLMVKNDDGNYEYHQPGCKVLLDKQKSPITAYTALSFKRQTVKINEVQTQYFYPQQRGNYDKTYLTTACYNCFVNASGDYDIDDIISGKVPNSDTVRSAFLTGLARERRDLYKSNFE